MFHRWISHDANPGDNCWGCFMCGIAIDFPDGYEDLALGMAPPCERNDGPAHHFILVGHPASEDAFFLECAYGDAAGDEINLGPGPYDPVCVTA
jgi:hypothetical protein